MYSITTNMGTKVATSTLITDSDGCASGVDSGVQATSTCIRMWHTTIGGRSKHVVRSDYMPDTKKIRRPCTTIRKSADPLPRYHHVTKPPCHEATLSRIPNKPTTQAPTGRRQSAVAAAAWARNDPAAAIDDGDGLEWQATDGIRGILTALYPC